MHDERTLNGNMARNCLPIQNYVGNRRYRPGEQERDIKCSIRNQSSNDPRNAKRKDGTYQNNDIPNANHRSNGDEPDKNGGAHKWVIPVHCIVSSQAYRDKQTNEKHCPMVWITTRSGQCRAAKSYSATLYCKLIEQTEQTERKKITEVSSRDYTIQENN